MASKRTSGAERRGNGKEVGPLPDLSSGWLRSESHFRPTESFKKELSRSVGQSLASILNNPHQRGGLVQPTEQSWVGWMMSPVTAVTSAVTLEAPAEGPPPLAQGVLPEVSRAEFQKYIQSISEPYSRFVDIREHVKRQGLDHQRAQGTDYEDEVEVEEATTSKQSAVSQGEGLAICLREIPPFYFDEDFALERASTFQQACPSSSMPANMLLQEKLSYYLDLVEQHLVQEIAARSASFYEALGSLEGLYSQVVAACEQISTLRSSVQRLDTGLVESAVEIQRLNVKRNNLLALHHKLKLVAYVNHAQSTLRMLITSGDCAGALDVIDDLRRMLESDELVGLHCFRRMGNELDTSLEAVNTVMAADFVRAAVQSTASLETVAIAARFQRLVASAFTLSLPDGNATFVSMSKADEEDTLEEAATMREQLLPLIIGLLRTCKLPAVLRSYRDTLITDIKAAIKCVVAEVLPILWHRPGNGEGFQENAPPSDADGGGLSLAYRLRGLTAENFVKLLLAVFDIVQERLVRAVEIRSVVEQILEGLDNTVAAAASAVAAARDREGAGLASTAELKEAADVATAVLGPAGSNKQFRADVMRENLEAVCAACDAAHSRWAKLLGVRTLVHPKLKLAEFVAIYNATQAFVAATEKIGGRPGYAIRGTLQSQSKAFVDAQHSSKMQKLAMTLDTESWTAIDAPDEYQAIATMLAAEDPQTSDLPSPTPTTSQTEQEQPISITEEPPSVSHESERVESNGSATSTTNGYRTSVELPNEATAAEGPSTSANGTVSGGSSSEAQDGPELERRESAASDRSTSGIPGDGLLPGAPQKEGGEGGPPAEEKKKKKAVIKTLRIRNMHFHAVNSALLLLSLLSEYLEVVAALPALATEIVHRVAEILKLFNSRTCQLVLGAGAMQVSGLKTITAKHLATASQSVSLYIALIPELRRHLAAHLPEARKALLLVEFDRVVQDFRVHRDEVHSKLVAIMRERLQVHLRMLPAITDHWAKPEEADPQPSTFARALIKEVGVLHRVLSSLLHEQDLQSIFTRVVLLFNQQLAEAYSKVDATSPPAKRRLYRDVKFVLSGLSNLPVAPSMQGKPRELEQFLRQRIGHEPPL